ncbi:phasin family protein [Telmatospirillum sp. J64-1]|uniref:phasin family protein n=1 Tax=Telmatospirillum sp. J64-1 TaxID=2502183 RepID=UPI00115C4FA8|nr:phasin family protein [Telmatospirillum sp. J64-1]
MAKDEKAQNQNDKAVQKGQQAANETAETGKKMAGEAGETGKKVSEEATETGKKVSEEAAESGKKMMDESAETAKKASEAGQRGMQQMADLGRSQSDQFRNMLAMANNGYSDMARFSRGDMEALIQSSARLAKGFQEISMEMMQFSQESMRKSLKRANELMECRSVEDMLSLQQDFMKESVDDLLQESAKLLQLSSRMTNDAVQPIQQRAGRGDN